MRKVKFSVFPNQTFIDLGLYQFGREACESGHSFGPARRNHYLFHYVINGRGTLYSDDAEGNTKVFKIHAGEGFMIYPEQVNLYVADANNPWEYTWLEFDGLRVKQALEAAGLTQEEPVYRTHFPELREKLRDEMLCIVDNSEASQFELIGHLYMFMDCLTRSAENAGRVITNRLRESYIREAISYIESNYHRNITVEEIAEALRINRSYFGKIFRLSTGKSPQRFIMNYRMTKAADMLMMTRKPINEIGASVGYENQMHFSRAFRNVYGVSPREWRSRHKDKAGSARKPL
ncbi:MAG: AraC family transcriptional regulator [Synergistaceae bacterium]|nr:AraC family transcriptional regulator [Synergistaceae bacterium]